MEQWIAKKSEFRPDGSLRDIYVFESDAELWNHLIREVRDSDLRHEFWHSNSSLELPDTFSRVKQLQNTDPTTLKIFLRGDIQVNSIG